MLLAVAYLTASPRADFKDQQMRFPRVRAAYKAKETWLRQKLSQCQVTAAGIEIYLRAFKLDRQLEVWVKGKSQTKYVLLTTYPFCASSGVLGPKRRQGDLQIPEGFYHIDRFNAWSNFHLSLGINYPNRSDRIKKSGKDPGGDIFIHGNCVTIGCIPITDDKIKELYILAVEARNGGQKWIPVHIFPARYNQKNWRHLQQLYRHDLKLLQFWRILKQAFDHFEAGKQVPECSINGRGDYLVRGQSTSP
jgi:murein L,D-transpeptidase YafK